MNENEDTIEMAQAYRWWTFGVLRELKSAPRALDTFLASLDPRGSMGGWDRGCWR